MRVLGIDPGLGRVGWGVVDRGGRQSKDVPRLYGVGLGICQIDIEPDWQGPDYLVACGCIETSPKSTLSQRLAVIYEAVGELAKLYVPQVAVVEELYFAKNAKTAMAVGQARGVILVALEQAGLPVSHFTPLEIKQAITGYGQADKKQMGYMVQELLGLVSIPKPDDTADGLAAALAYTGPVALGWENDDS